MMNKSKASEEMTCKDIDFTNPALLTHPCNKLRGSPITVTLGNHPVTTVDIQQMMEAGMNVVHMSLSSTTTKNKIAILGKVVEATSLLCEKYLVHNWPIATSIELKTCMVNTGILEEECDHVTIKEGSYITLTHNLLYFDRCNASKIFVDNPYLTKDIKIGTEITIDQEEIIIVCKEILPEQKSIKGIVTKGGNLKSMQNVCARGGQLSRPFVSNKDLEVLKFALDNNIDMIVVYYVRSPDTITKIKEYIDSMVAKRPILIGGLCTKQGLNNIDDLIKVTDGVLFAREFLTYEVDAPSKYRMAQIQKWVGAKCQQAGKPFYISGGVFQLALMTGFYYDNEISDVTNALLDGVTGFVLKDFENIEYGIEGVKSMNKLCCAVEPLAHTERDFWRIIDSIKMPITAAEAAVMSCVVVANKTNARVIILPTVSGQTAKALVRMRPSCTVITVSRDTRATRLIYTYRCCVPLLYTGTSYSNWNKNVKSRILFAIEHAVTNGWIGYGDTYITLQKSSDTSSYCDVVQIWRVEISKKVYVECPEEEVKGEH